MTSRAQRGFGLIEGLVTISVLAILAAVAIPSFQQMIVNGRTRTIAESFRAGADLARTEAMRRNMPVSFAAVSSDTGCSASTTGKSWVVFLGSTCDNNATVVQRFVAGGSEAGVTVSLVARRCGVSPNQLFTWRRLAEQGALTATAAEEEVVPASAFRAQQEQIRELQRLLGKKTLEVEILKDALELAEDIKKRRLRSLSLPKDGLP